MSRSSHASEPPPGQASEPPPGQASAHPRGQASEASPGHASETPPGAAPWGIHSAIPGAAPDAPACSGGLDGEAPRASAALLERRRPCQERAHAAELLERSHWFIQTRWIAVGLCLAGSLWALAPPFHALSGCHVDYRFFLAVALLLGISNLIYARLSRRLTDAGPGSGSARDGVYRVLRAQVFTDFINLSLLAYGLGGVETPILILFLPHIILSTLFFTRRCSLTMTGAGILFAVGPMFLEYLGVLPTLSIFDSAHKAAVISGNPVITLGYMAAIAAAFLICWYLVSEITFSLRLRECQLEKAFDQVNLLNREKSQITLRAIHELKAPFAAIKSYVYTLRDGYCGALPEAAQKAVGRIGARCDLLSEKITDIIHLSNLRTAPPGQEPMVRLSLRDIAAEEVKEARLRAAPRQVALRWDGGPDGCPIRGSAALLSTLISNLLENAIAYSHEGGVVEARLRRRGGRAALEIEDHGIGIPAERIDAVFEPHFRANNALKHNPNGNGMGLALVKETVRLLDGEIAIASRLNQGTTFTVDFACADDAATGGEDGQDPDHR